MSSLSCKLYDNNFSFSYYLGGVFAMCLGVLVLIIEMCFVVEDFSWIVNLFFNYCYLGTLNNIVKVQNWLEESEVSPGISELLTAGKYTRCCYPSAPSRISSAKCKACKFSFDFQVLVAFACDLTLDCLPCCTDGHEWAWFRRFCMASRVARSLELRTPLPPDFCIEVQDKISEMVRDSEQCSEASTDHAVFRREHDEQLLLWLNQWVNFIYFVCQSSYQWK